MSDIVQTGSTSASAQRWREILIVVGICVVGLTVRLVVLGRWAETALFLHPVGDELNFHRTALSLLSLGPEAESFFYQPLYPFYLVLVYTLFGVDVALVRTIQLFIAMGTVLLFYGLGRELGGRWTGRLAALLAALYGPLVFFEAHLLSPGITVPLTTGALWCLVAMGKRDRTWLAFPSALLAGLATMGRPNLAALFPVAAFWLLFQSWTWNRRLAALALALAGVVLGLSPSWLHNLAKGEGSLPVSSAGGNMFFIGNNPQATGWFHVPHGEGLDAQSHESYRRNAWAVAERAENQRLGAEEVSSYWFRRGLDFWRAQPGKALWLLGKKLLLACNSEELPIHTPYLFGLEWIPLLGFLLTFGVVFPFGMLGIFLGVRRERNVRLLAWCLVAYLLTLMAFFVSDRYRILTITMLIPLAALGMVRLKEQVRSGGLRRCVPALLILAGAVIASQLPLFGARAREQALAEGYIRLGKAEGDIGHLGQAEACFRRGLELVGPERGSLALANLGLVKELQGDLRGAWKDYLEAANSNPEERSARKHLALLAERLGDREDAIRWWKELRALLADPSPADQEIWRLESQPPQPAP